MWKGQGSRTEERRTENKFWREGQRVRFGPKKLDMPLLGLSEQVKRSVGYKAWSSEKMSGFPSEAGV